jgi:hypothetical protein
MNNKTSEIEDIEVIPTAMYEPVNDVDIEVSENGSEDSEDFADRVFKTFEKDSTKSREGRWLARCELRDENIIPDQSLMKKYTTSVKISKLDDDRDDTYEKEGGWRRSD